MARVTGSIINGTCDCFYDVTCDWFHHKWHVCAIVCMVCYCPQHATVGPRLNCCEHALIKYYLHQVHTFMIRTSNQNCWSLEGRMSRNILTATFVAPSCTPRHTTWSRTEDDERHNGKRTALRNENWLPYLLTMFAFCDGLAPRPRLCMYTTKESTGVHQAHGDHRPSVWGGW